MLPKVWVSGRLASQASSWQCLSNVALPTPADPMLPSGQPVGSAPPPALATRVMITMSLEEYDQWSKSKASTLSSHASHHASSSYVGTALLTSSPAIETLAIDSDASAHMSGISSLLTRLKTLNYPETVTIADCCLCSVTSKEVAAITPSLSLDNILYVPTTCQSPIYQHHHQSPLLFS